MPFGRRQEKENPKNFSLSVSSRRAYLGKRVFFWSVSQIATGKDRDGNSEFFLVL